MSISILMPNEKVFCNVPWSNLHLYWDGSFGACCSEQEKIYDDSESQKYNIANMTVSEWFNSKPMEDFRQKINSEQHVSACRQCYKQESLGHESRRIKENFKSVIFTELNFHKSYKQSPWYKHFEESKNKEKTSLLPIDWHIDLGNECNFACKMCDEKASSKIASYLKIHKKYSGPTTKDWSKNKTAYDNFLQAIDTISVKRIHFMGGEPTLSKSFYKIIDYLIANKRHEISLSFVTNGSKIDTALFEKLKYFERVDIEISIESLYKNNDYIRQGCDTESLVKTIKDFNGLDNKINIVLRTVPQLLSVNNYSKLIQFASQNNLIIESIPLIEPDFLQVNVLPQEIRIKFISELQDLKNTLSKNIQFKTIQNGRSLGTINQKLIRECDTIINMCNEKTPENVNELENKLCNHLMFWDNIYNLKALEIYPEYASWLRSIGYA